MALEILNSFAFQKKRLQAISCEALLLPLLQPYQRDGSRRFYLAIPGCYLLAPTASRQNVRWSATVSDQARSGSLRSNLAGTVYKQVARLRYER
jgi:hypothetical protein